jgi:nitrile hydratase accessory protein
MVVAMYEAGHFTWDDFRVRLMAQVTAAGEHDGSDYYRHWLSAFEELMSSREVLSEDLIDARVAAIAAADRHDGSSA